MLPAELAKDASSALLLNMLGGTAGMAGAGATCSSDASASVTASRREEEEERWRGRSEVMDIVANPVRARREQPEGCAAAAEAFATASLLLLQARDSVAALLAIIGAASCLALLR